MALRLPTTVAAVRAALDSGDYAALNNLAEIDHVFTIHEDGTITDGPPGIYAPYLTDGELDPGADRWEMLNGYSGQDRYSGPIMHDSEFLGGGMARDVLSQPGTYVCVAAQYLCTDEEHANGEPVTDDDPRATFMDGAGVDHTYVDHGQCESYWEGWALCKLIPADDTDA